MQSLARRLENGGALPCPGIAAPARPLLAALLQKLFPARPIVIVTENLKAQENFHQDLETWLQVAGAKLQVAGADTTSNLQPSTFDPLFYPAWEILPHEGKLPHADVISDRLQTLVALSGNSERKTQNSKLVVTSVPALLQKTFAPADLRARARQLSRGDKLAPLDLIDWLEEQGYEPEAQVTQRSEIALRGGIVDLFPPTSPWPVRLEFFGDELESLRYFDPLTQISREEIAGISIPPAGELGILKQISGGTAVPEGRVTRVPDHEMGTRIARPPQLATLLDFLPRETIFLLCDPEALAIHADLYAQSVPANDPFYIAWPDFLADLHRRGLTSVELIDDEYPEPGLAVPLAPFHGEEMVSGGPSDSQETERVQLLSPLPPEEGQGGGTGHPLFSSLDAFRPLADRPPEPPIAEAQRREFFHQLHRWLRQGYAVHVFCNNAGERQRFAEIWKDYGFDEAGSARCTDRTSQRDTPTVHVGALARGFLCGEARLVVVTDAEIFGRYKVQRPRRLKSPHAQITRSALDIDFTDLQEGDLVVHLQHGIGRYRGLKNLPATSGTRGVEPSTSNLQPATECLVIEYAPGSYGDEAPKLYVPVSEAHLVSKYVGAGKAHPPLNTLGGTRWAKAKEQTEKAVRDVAAELLRIQAVRESQQGQAFKPDTQWQREFESAFIYEETPDQLTAITQTKTDMERPKPMDRLICGDVGYGKTEVAIRAAFKCVMDGKQTAVLVPTTVLAQQHFNTFRERMADYPVRIELLSRFRTRREQQKIIKDLANGAVDIIIGTHRLVQEDIAFKDLGLVVIDEEQRFGVLHKEKFKRLRTLVDVLTLSATPIPRTLYLALTGARDMSTIQTPPHDRLPVETVATQYDERLIRDVIKRELNRGGQVFFLHNRVTTIDAMRAKLQSLVPDARIVVGHGQMDADNLEEVMTKFVNGEADVLLSTTIIESGLDIPNANTIIIDRADRFGLSELYQLRGRVGRYKHQAYAYLLLPRHARLLTDVRKRISAMKQYSTLGSGFKIAMRDLEIRGAGNLLGAEQSGHITAVGFELYCQLLKQSVGALKGEKVKPRIAVRVALDFLDTTGRDGMLPSEENSGMAGKSGRWGERPREPLKPAMDDLSETSLPPRAGRAGSPLPAAAASGRDQAHSDGAQGTARPTTAGLPAAYVPEPHHRIEIYRKLAQVTDKPALDALQRELRDRFGPLPPPVEMLLAVTELKILASDKSVTVIEVESDKLKLTRHNDLITLGGKFPRLTKKEPKARLKEIKRLLLAI